MRVKKVHIYRGQIVVVEREQGREIGKGRAVWGKERSRCKALTLLTPRETRNNERNDAKSKRQSTGKKEKKINTWNKWIKTKMIGRASKT